MVFPTTVLPVTVELQLNGVWTDVTQYTYLRDRIQITRGRRDEAGSFEPDECQVTFNNRLGRFSPRNPTGPYYGQLTRNTPIRVSAVAGATRLTGRSSAPDTAGISVTGDLDVRLDMRLPTWNTFTTFASKITDPSQRSWLLVMNASGSVSFFWTSDGATYNNAASTVSVPGSTGRQAIRATIDVDNGAGGRTITFYTASTIAGPWTQLGDPVIQAGTTSIFDSTAPIFIGSSLVSCEVYGFKLLQGINGTERANPDLTIQSDGATSFADAAGNTWTNTGGAQITARRYRFYGEVPSWPQAWDISERDVYTPVAATGILRRLGQGSAPLQSALRRGIASEMNLVAYWPMEDADGSTRYASAVAGAPAMSIGGTPTFASSTDVPGSDPLPVLASSFGIGNVPAAATGTITARCVVDIPAAGDTNLGVLMRVYTSGTIYYWDFYYATTGGGTLVLGGFDNTHTIVIGPNTTHTGVNGKLFTGAIELQTSGGNVAYALTTLDIATDSGLQTSGTVAGSVGCATGVLVNPDAGTRLVNTVVGHPHILSSLSTNPYGFEEYVRGWAGETAGRRIERLCSEESVAFTAYGNLDTSAAMGVQRSNRNLLELIAECEDVDLGQLFESRAALALAYRPRLSRAVQGAALPLVYDALRELQPVEDDQATRNDVTVSRTDGSSARATVTTGPLSTQAPPTGVGRYDEALELNLFTDDQCAQQANWRVIAGTIDEPRYPRIGVELAGSAFAASQTLIAAALDLDHGDRITVTGTPVWLPPGTIEQHAIGYTETLSGERTYPIDYVCQPAKPTGSAGVYNSGAMRWATAGSTLNGAITSSALSASVATTTGPIWTTAGGDFPMDIVIAGERITVSAISGTSSPQTFTFSARGVNGVTKAQASGAAVQIADPTYYAL